MKLIFMIIIFCSLNFSQNTYLDSAQIKNPSHSWKLNIIPGLGYLYNENYEKTFLINFALSYTFSELQEHNSINRRNELFWWLIGLYVFGIIDSYVDAHLSSFPKTKKVID